MAAAAAAVRHETRRANRFCAPYFNQTHKTLPSLTPETNANATMRKSNRIAMFGLHEEG